MNKTYFISGPTNYDVKWFIRDYIPLIKTALDENAYFIIGDKDGVDAMAQSYIAQHLKDDDPKGRVKIFFKGNEPINFLNNNFMAVPHFKSNEEANAAMTLCSDEDIVCLEEGYWNSECAKNICRRYTPNYNFNKFFSNKDCNIAFWESIFKSENNG